MKNKILSGLMFLSLGFCLLPIGVKAEETVGDSIKSEEHNVTIKGIEENSENIYSIDIEWANLQYTYYYSEYDDSYHWSPTLVNYSGTEVDNLLPLPERANYVEVTNDNVSSLIASLTWNPSISGVTSTINSYVSTTGTGTCGEIEDIEFNDLYTHVWAWNSQRDLTLPHEINTNKDSILYSDATCTTIVPEGAIYEPTTKYYKVSNNVTYTSNDNYISTLLDGKSSPNVYATGSYNQTHDIHSTVRFTLELHGGSLADVTAANETSSKKIGSVTLVIYSVGNGL